MFVLNTDDWNSIYNILWLQKNWICVVEFNQFTQIDMKIIVEFRWNVDHFL